MSYRKPLAIILALVLFGMIAPLIHAPYVPGTGSPNYTVSFSPTDPAATTFTLPNPVPANYNVTAYVWLCNATMATIDTAQALDVAVGGIEVHLDMTPLLTYFTPISFADDVVGNTTNNPEGCFNNTAPATILVGIPAGFYGNDFEYAASTGTAFYTLWSPAGEPQTTAGLIASITFEDNVLAPVYQPAIAHPNFVATLGFTADMLTSMVDFAAAAPINFDEFPGTVTIPAAVPAPYAYPATEPEVYLTDASLAYSATPTYDESAMANNTLFNVTVAIGNNQQTLSGVDPKWDIAGFDVGITWNNTLINYMGGFEGGFLSSGGCATLGLTGGSFTNGFANSVVGDQGTAEAVFTKTTDPTPASGIDSLVVFEFQIVYAPPAGIVTTGPIAFIRNYTEGFYLPDLASWDHPEIASPPWNGSLTAADMGPPNNAPFTWTANGGYPIPAGFVGVGADAVYYAPYTTPFVPGGYLDLYDQYPAPYGGQGYGEHSDSFAPQELVILYAKVTFNGGILVNKLVSFQINDANGTKWTLLQNYTDHNGIATVEFRIPQEIQGAYASCGQDPWVFGWWEAFAQVEIDQNITGDYMWFQVGYLAQVLRVDIDNTFAGSTMATANHQNVNFTSTLNTSVGEQEMDFTVLLLTIHEQALTPTISVDTYDVEGYPLTENYWTSTVNATRIPGIGNNTADLTNGGVFEYGTVYYPGIVGNPTNLPLGTSPIPVTILPSYFAEDPTQTTPILSMPNPIQAQLPYWARLSPYSGTNQYGYASVIGYCLTALPVNQGVPYGPQSNANDLYLPSNPLNSAGQGTGTPFYINGPG